MAVFSRSLIFFCLVSWSTSTSCAEEFIRLNEYTCADFLRDSKEPADGTRLLRSLMMIAWAAGYAASFQEGAPRADPTAIQLISATLGDACRRSPTTLTVQAISKAITQVVKSKSTPNSQQKRTPETSVIGVENTKPFSNIVALKPHAESTGTFSTYDNFDSPSFDIQTLKNVDLSRCAAACETDRDCSVYTFDKWNRWCFLKSRAVALSFEPRSTTGVKIGVELPPPSDFAIRIDHQLGRKFAGSSRKFSGVSTEVCEKICEGDDRCMGYTFFQKEQSCYLFDKISSYVRDARSKSGLKTQTKP